MSDEPGGHGHGTRNNPNQPPVDQPPQWLHFILNGLRSDLEDHVVIERHRHRLPALVERLDEFEADLTSDYDRINALETKKNQMKRKLRKLRKLHLTA